MHVDDLNRQTCNIRNIQIPTLKCLSSRLAVVFAQSIETRYLIENEDVVAAAPTGDAPITPKWSTSLLPTDVPFILDADDICLAIPLVHLIKDEAQNMCFVFVM